MRLLLPLLLVTVLCTRVPAQETENLIIITMDGLRWQELFGGAVDTMVANEALTEDRDRMRDSYLAGTPEARRRRLMPFFWDTVAVDGLVFGNRWAGNLVNCSNPYWFSYPGYNEILTGAADPAIDSNDKLPNRNITLLEWLNRRPEFSGKVAAFASWDVFDWIVNEERSGIPVNSGYNTATGPDLSERERYLNKLQEQAPRLWGGVRPDFLTHGYMMAYLRREHPRVVYISYGETDDFAHDGSYNRYLDAAHATDRMWSDLWAYLQSDPFYRGKTSLVFTTDHGRGDSPMEQWDGHGTSRPGSDAVWIAVVGPDTPATGVVTEEQQLYQSQIARSAAALLGLDYAPEGREVGGVLPGILREGRK